MSGHDSATAAPLRASLHAPPGCLSLPKTTRRWQPPDGFEPQAGVALRPSPLHLTEKLSKKLLRFRKMVAPFSAMILRRHVRDVAEKQLPDPDEDTCSETPNASLSSRISSSSIDSLVVPPHKTAVFGGSQMMASMLLSLMGDEGEDASAGSEDDEEFAGPRVSAWHQPEPDEIVSAQQDWRFPRHGATSSTLVSQTVKNTEAADYVSYKYLATGASVPDTAVHRYTVTILDCLWVRGELPHLLASVLEVFQFNAGAAA